MKTNTYKILQKLTFVILLCLAGKTHAQGDPTDCIQFSNCPQSDITICADTYNPENPSEWGAILESWTVPSASETCSISGGGTSFYMDFQLNEALLGKDCWDFNYVQRVGTDGGYLKLFSSSGAPTSYVITPYLYLDTDDTASIQITYTGGNYKLNLYYIDENGVQSTLKDSYDFNGLANGVYNITLDPQIPVNDSYRIKYEFVYTGTKPANTNLADKISIDGVVIEGACTGGVEFTVSGPKPPKFLPVGTHHLCYIATYTDPNGTYYSEECCLTVHVIDTAPVITCPAPIAQGTDPGLCTATVTIPMPTATDVNCTGTDLTANLTITSTRSDNLALNAPYPVGVTIITHTATDDNGATVSCEQTVTISGDSAAEFNTQPQPIADINCNDTLPTQEILTASNCNGPVTVVPSVESDPVNLCDGYTITYIWTAGTTVVSQSFEVLPDTTPPTGTAPNDLTNLQCITDVPAADINAVTNIDDNCNAVTVSVTDSDNGGSGCNSEPLIITRTYTLTDTCGNFADLVQIITVEDTTPPTGTAPAAISGLQCIADVPTADIDAVVDEADNCLGDVTVSVTDIDNGASGCNGSPYIVTRTYTLTDCGGLETELVQTITVEDTTPPTGTAPAAISGLQCIADIPAADINTVIDEADNCSGAVTVNVNDTNNAASGCNGNPYIVTRTYTLTDCGGLETELVQTITVENTTPPTITGGANGSAECTGSNPADNADYIAWRDSFAGLSASGNCSNASLSFDEGNWTSVGCTDTINVMFTATDACGLTSNKELSFTITDTTPPVLAGGANDSSESTSVNPADNEAYKTWRDGYAGITGFDLCGDVTMSYEEGAWISVGCGYQITVNFKATDACGFTTDRDHRFTISDNTPPSLSGGADGSAECTGSNPADNIAYLAWRDNFAGITSSDVSGSTTMSYTEGIWITAGCTTSIAVTFTAEDECGLTASQDQIFIISDTTPPVLAGGDNGTGECTGSDSAINAEYIAWRDGYAGITSTDICGDTSLSFSEGTWSSNGCTESITVTFTATDACGLTTDQDYTFTILDTTPPTGTAPAAISGLECIDDVPAADISAITDAADNCGGNVTVSVTDSNNGASGCYGSPYIVTRTYTLTDCTGLTTDLIQTITVEDTTPPTGTAPLAITGLECISDVPAADINAITDAADNCGGNVSVSVSDSNNAASGCNGNPYIVTRTYTLTDCGGLETELVQTITVEDTTPPTGTAPAAISGLQCIADIPAADKNAVIDIADNCSGEVIVEVNDTNNAGSGCNGNPYIVTRTYTLIDCGGLKTELLQTITVEDTTPPTGTAPADITGLQCISDVPAADINAISIKSDNCGGNVAVSVSDTNNGGAGCISDPYIVTRTYTLTDCGGLETKLTQTITVEDTTAPIITKQASPISVQCDPDSADDPIGDWLALNGGATATDNCGEVTWTNDYGDDASIKCDGTGILVTFTAKDSCGNTSTTSATYLIQDVLAPVITTVAADQTVECNGSGNIDEFEEWLAKNAGAVASDDCSAVKWSNDFTTFNYDCGMTGGIIVRFTATDGCGNSSYTSAKFTIEDNIAPTFNVPDDIEIFTDADCNYDASVSVTGDVENVDDACSSDIQAQYTDVITPGLCEASMIITRTWTLSDACGNNAISQVQEITVTDKTAPTFTAPANIEIFSDADCNYDADVAFTGDVTDATDNCSSDLQATYVDSEPVVGDCPGSYTITRTWSLVDDCGNAAENQVQSITVTDNTAPTFTAPADIEIYTDAECNYDADIAFTGDVMDEADNCSVDLQATFVDSDPVAGDCPGSYTITRTWSLVDDCGNPAEDQVQIITISDNTAPTFTVPGSTEIVTEIFTDANCNYDIDVTITGDVTDEADNCSENLQATFVDSDPVAGNCPGSYTIIRTWSLVDDCGNKAEDKTQSIRIIDATAPTFTAPASLDVSCEANVEDLTITGDVTDEADNCSTGLQASYQDTIAEGDCPNERIITRVWSLSDACGNAADDQIQTITVIDDKAPEPLTTFASELTVSCSDIPEAPEPGFGDNCSTITADHIVFEETSTLDANNQDDYQIIRTWKVSDDCNNTAVYEQVVNVTTTEFLTQMDDRKCSDDGVIDLDTYLIATDDNASWTIISGSTNLNGSLFDPENVELGFYTFSYTSTTDAGCLETTEVKIEIHGECIPLPCGAEDVVISKAVTPNGDLYNENFEITGVEACGFEFAVKIFNRWGALIYENNNYQNDWNGRAHKSSIGNSDTVPNGTYYYIVTLKDSGLEPFTGPIYVGTK